MSGPNRLQAARDAFSKGDNKASALAHDLGRIAQAAHGGSEEHGGASSQYLGEMVYGGLDGIVTTFAVVSGVAGAQLSSDIVLILGLANLFADGFSMAVGSYLSTQSEQEYYQRERDREMWEVEHFPEGERAELLELYKARGYSEKDARDLVEIQSRDPKRWVDAMMVDELGMLPDERKPLISSLTTFGAFVVAGAVPLLVYLLGLFTQIPAANTFPISLGLSGLALFGLGAAKVLVTHRNPLRSGLEMLLVGGLAAGVAYVVGALLRGIAG
ncbi:MAG: VIT1/CCC1 transporter family protein [Anaerolineales bacterium]